MELIIIIAIIFYVIKSKKAAEGQVKKNTQAQDPWQQVAMDTLMKEQTQSQQRAQAQAHRREQEARKAEQEARRAQQEAKRAQEEAERALIQRAQEEAERAKAQKAYMQTQAQPQKTKVPTIVQRAKANVAENAADVTLETMEREHDHSERVAPAVHHHPEDILPESMLGTVEDLMVKGFDGNLCFERDFVGEAMDMINRFTA